MDMRVAAYAVIVDNGRILLAHWNEHGHSGWTLPGGGIDPGEDPADAARREIFEETGYAAELDELLAVDSHVIRGRNRIEPAKGPLHALRIIYRAHIVGGELTHEISGSTDQAAWFGLEEVAALQRVELVNIAMGFTGD